jgi:transposase-like protein
MDTSQANPEVARPAKRGWRRHSDEFKSRVIELVRQGGGSVAAVALANGLNANMLRRWVREADGPSVVGRQSQVSALPTFVRLPMPATQPTQPTQPTPPPAPTDAPPNVVVVEIQRSGAAVRVSLPLSTVSAVWLREVLG